MKYHPKDPQAMLDFEANKPGRDLWEAFQVFHRSYPEVYAKFKQFAHEALSQGRERFGGMMIYQRLRWYWRFERRTYTADEYKLNNNHVPFYVRLLIADEPEFSELFQTRRMKYEPTDDELRDLLQ